jgi:hypothetical protein
MQDLADLFVVREEDGGSVGIVTSPAIEAVQETGWCTSEGPGAKSAGVFGFPRQFPHPAQSLRLPLQRVVQ